MDDYLALLDDEHDEDAYWRLVELRQPTPPPRPRTLDEDYPIDWKRAKEGFCE